MNKRKIAPSRLTAASAGFLAVFLMIACGKSEEKPSGAPPALLDRTERSAIIRLEVDPNSQPIRIIEVATDDSASNGKELALSRSNGEHAHLTVDRPSANVRIEIGLKPGSLDPFEPGGNDQPNPKHLYSKKVSKKAKLSKELAPGEKYEYWVKVYVLGTDRVFTLDPTIRVDP